MNSENEYPAMGEMHRREYGLPISLRSATEGDGRTISGLAVPYDTPTQITPKFTEIIAHGACVPRLEPTPAFYRHDDVIGTVTHHEHTPQGWAIDMRLSDTAQGRDALTLVKDAALTRFSIGFDAEEYTDEWDENGHLTRTVTLARVFEVSLVPQPAFLGAVVESIRHAHQPPTTKEPPMTTTNTVTVEHLDAAVTELREEVRTLTLNTPAPTPEPVETRSAGAILKDALRGDESAIQSLAAASKAARNFDGIKAADGRGTVAHATWVKDLTRLIDQANPLAAFFDSDSLPDEGMFLEFGQLGENTIQVGEQAAEGDNLLSGTISVKEDNTRVRTHGGHTKLSRQAIDRAPVNMLNLAMRAMALAAGRHAAATLVAELNAAVKSRLSSAFTVSKAPTALKWADWIAMLIDVAAIFREVGLPIPPLFVNSATFKAMAALTDKDDRPIFTLAAPSPHQAGTLAAGEPSKLEELGLSTLRVVHNAAAKPDDMGSGVVGAFASPLALRRYSSPVSRLQDSNILNLSEAFSVYTYDAYALEVPAGIVPFKMGG